MMKRIYLAGALNAMAVDYIKNVHKMIIYAQSIRDKGNSVFVPCLDLLNGLVIGNMEYNDYADNNMSWLEVADELWVMPGWENSAGTKKEIERAKQLNITIKFLGDA